MSYDLRAAAGRSALLAHPGVDLKGVATVLNADVPPTARDYVHRVGRCARGGQSGTALTLCTHEEEQGAERVGR